MNFDELITVADWTQALQHLLDQAKQAAQRSDQDEMNAVQDLLFEFQQQSPPSMNSLDAIAFDAAQSLNRTQREAILSDLTTLINRLNDLSRVLGLATEQALQASEEIQLRNTKDFLTKAKVSLGILQGLRTDLQDESSEIGAKIQALLNAINDFEQAF